MPRPTLLLAKSGCVSNCVVRMMNFLVSLVSNRAGRDAQPFGNDHGTSLGWFHGFVARNTSSLKAGARLSEPGLCLCFSQGD